MSSFVCYVKSCGPFFLSLASIDFHCFPFFHCFCFGFILFLFFFSFFFFFCYQARHKNTKAKAVIIYYRFIYLHHKYFPIMTEKIFSFWREFTAKRKKKNSYANIIHAYTHGASLCVCLRIK